MKVILEKGPFKNALERASRIIATKPTSPILSHLLLQSKYPINEESGEGTLVITGADAGDQISIKIAADVEEEGEATLPASNLIALVNAFPNLAIYLEDAETVVKGDCRINLTSGMSTVYSLLGIDAGFFPHPPEMGEHEKFKVPASILLQSLDRTIWACSTSPDRPQLAGIHFRGEKGSSEIDIYGGNMGAASMVRVGLADALPCPLAATLSATRCDVLRTTLKGQIDDVVAGVTENLISFEIGGIRLISALTSGKYQNPRKIWTLAGRSQKIAVKIHPEQMADILNRASVITDNQVKRVELEVRQEAIEFHTARSGVGTGMDALPVEFVSGDEDYQVDMHFSAKVLMDPLSLCEGAFEAGFGDPLSPVLFTLAEDWHYLAMPLQPEVTK